ncbi:right-handed parallel beta-helix repeat-containing protein [Methanobacterium sp.]|uniref:right-handed parallel beta-helix repeat-containing protein n=1 Tax=Methanobacterium sp. TaxID=2164 RepID=UPI0025E99FCD|nr:right-handed parallel beta-helix repeat-containing protein [Methanobacterium sp.]MBI5460114.1 hypothetical protein [Methanobacterium sp.]
MKESKSLDHKIMVPLTILILIFVFIILIGAVSADQSIIYVSTQGDDSHDGQNPTWNGTSGPKLTIKNATNTVSENGVVNIANGDYMGSDNREIIIEKNMSIVGQSKENTVIDAENLGQIFLIQPSLTVFIEKLTLINGNTCGANDGGALRNCGSVTVIDCNFTGNTGNFGGAVYNEGNMTLINSNFISNQAYFDGGVIYNNNEGTVTGCSFQDNTADGLGGAIDNEGSLDVAESTFINNSVGDSSYGGAIFNSINLVLSKCIFTDNTASGWGGAIDNEGNVTVTDSNFQKNNAPSGGAIYNKNPGTIKIINSDFSDNTAIRGPGGAIVNGYTCILQKSTFTNNKASDYGGAIYTADTCTLNNCDFTANTAYFMGGAIYNVNNCTMEDCDFTANTVNFTGGAISNSGECSVKSSTFTGNRAGNGGAIYNDFDSICSVKNCDFVSNQGSLGGAIFNQGNLIAIINTFTSNKASQGSVFYTNSKNTEIHFNCIANNIGIDVYSYGSGAYAENNWWGTNFQGTNPIAIGRVTANVIADPWLILEFTVNPIIIMQGQISTLLANVNRNSNGMLVGDASNHVPDGTPITFTTTLGNVGSKLVTIGTMNGIATATLRGDEAAGEALLSVFLDSQTLTRTVTIKARPGLGSAVNAANTVGMQSTGIPINGLILAILMVISGLVLPKRR